MTARRIEPCPRCRSTHVNKGKAPRRISCPTVNGVYVAFGAFAAAIVFDWGTTTACVLAAIAVVVGIAAEVMQACEVWLRCHDCGCNWAAYSWELPPLTPPGNRN